ncbi:hypothetical protein GCM10010174_65780 [Kutzneria viridogrisea]
MLIGTTVAESAAVAGGGVVSRGNRTAAAVSAARFHMSADARKYRTCPGRAESRAGGVQVAFAALKAVNGPFAAAGWAQDRAVRRSAQARRARRKSISRKAGQ